MMQKLSTLKSIQLVFLIALLIILPTQFTLASRRQVDQTAATLDTEINALSADLGTEKDFSINTDRRFLNKLAEEFARASTRDLKIKVLPGRVMSSRSDLGFAKYDNYLDLDGGEGAIDLRGASVEGIKDGRINLLIDVAGQVKARAHGQQIGFNYQANPEIAISLGDRVAFIIEPEGGQFRLRPVPKRLVAHLNIGVYVPVLGTKVNATRDVPFDIATVMRPITLPPVISPNLRLPASGRTIVLTNAGYQAENSKLRIDAELGFK
ncbi:MAG: hypothetical protein AB1489_23675 [Acidobacteriota bacterium]